MFGKHSFYYTGGKGKEETKQRKTVTDQRKNKLCITLT